MSYSSPMCTFIFGKVSLLSLSRVSSRYAEVCQSLLYRRGIVTPIWERVTCSPTGLVSWRITAFVWSLPICGEPIHTWNLGGSAFSSSSKATPSSVPDSMTARMCRHLAKDCAFYEVLRAKEPFCLHNQQKLPFS